MASERSPHLLYVAWGFPPSRGAGMYRALATANAFADAGWRVTVLTPIREVFATLTDLDPLTEALIDQRITVRRVEFDLRRSSNNLAEWPRWRAVAPLLWNGVALLRERVQFPEARYGGWRQNLVFEALQVHESDPVDLVIGTANPNVDFTPGWALHRKFGVPYVMDYRDTWHLNMYTGKRTAAPSARSSRWESRMLSRASEVWFVNEPIREWHVTQHPGIANRSFVVSNGFDKAILQGLQPRRREKGEPLSIGYLGTVYGPMPLQQTFDGWVKARERSPLLARSTLDLHGRLGHYAIPDAGVQRLIDRYESHGVRYHGKVSKTEVSRVYSTFDGLTLILGRSPYITSGKVFEYVATGLPIAAMHHPDTASTSVLAEYPRFVPARDDSADAFADAFIELAEMIESSGSEDRAKALVVADRWERMKQLGPRLEALRRIVEGES